MLKQFREFCVCTGFPGLVFATTLPPADLDLRGGAAGGIAQDPGFTFDELLTTMIRVLTRSS
ncbi:MAG: hypothetical protein IPP17_28570 [Bacteroidetes bacterium]|nr:hypothetical protein [Bacteroidota bacterium]